MNTECNVKKRNMVYKGRPYFNQKQSRSNSSLNFKYDSNLMGIKSINGNKNSHIDVPIESSYSTIPA